MSKSDKHADNGPRSQSEREERLRARRILKMAKSSQRYIRGSTARFYQWLGGEHALPEGPPVWICGDCHYGNLGPIANVEDDVAVQIRDFDQAVIGNPAHDVIRLALSLASTVRSFDLPGSTTAALVEQIVDAYQTALTAPHDPAEDRPPMIEGLVRTSQRRDWDQLARERLKDPSPHIPLGKHFWPLLPGEWEVLENLVASPSIRGLVTQLQSRPDDAEAHLLDAAYWVKGCSSLGLLRYALLVGVGDGKHRQLCLIDVKEAVHAAAPRSPDVRMPKDNATRVVRAARALSPYLGERMRAARLLGKSVFVRELRPQDLKLELAHLDVDRAICVSRFLAGVAGRAHARQMALQDRERWAAELLRNRSKSLDAPSWLWSSVVDLIAQHEAAYLEHCRRNASLAA